MLRQRKVPKRKATPSLRPLRGAKGQPASGRLRGAPWNSLCAGARRSDSHGELDNEACALRRACSPRNRPAAGAASRGWEADSRIPTAEQPHGPSRCSAPNARALCAATARPSAAMARMDVRLPSPFRMRRGAQGVGWACAEGHTLRELTRCGCLSGARSAQRVPQRTPRPSTAGCPQRSEGTQRVGSPFLW